MHSDNVWNELELQRKMKTLSLEHALWQDVNRLELPKKMKTRTVNVAFSWYLKRFETFMSRLVGAHPSPPLVFNFCSIFLIFKMFDFLEKVVGRSYASEDILYSFNIKDNRCTYYQILPIDMLTYIVENYFFWKFTRWKNFELCFLW